MKFLFVLTLFTTSLCNAAPPDIQGADLSYTHPHYREKLAQIWNFIQSDLAQLGNKEIVPPVLHLEPFERAKQSSAFTAWQNDWMIHHASVWLEWTKIPNMNKQDISEDWIRAHIGTIYPFPPAFRGFHYYGTNHLHVNPNTTYLAYLQSDPYGNKTDYTGYGYYVSGHEMTHYALAQRGIPDKLHHCIFVSGPSSLMLRLANFLEKKSLVAAPMLEFLGLQQEISMAPCAQLTAEERAEALRLARELEQAQ